jgi:CheY-like chemotaxis protein
MSDLFRHSLGADVKLETVLAGGVWPVFIDQNQLESILLNLAVNARDAMPEGGRLTIKTQNTHLDARYVADEAGVASGQYVMLAVTDTGSGMSPDVIAKAFDPFFTTKEVGKGTGLGLSQVYGFIKQSGGHIRIYSEVGQGTTVKIYLPRHLGPASAADAEKTETELPEAESRELILVVDDEEIVRNFSIEALMELGYAVLSAGSAAEALAIISERDDIDLLFTDIVMPETNGRKLSDMVQHLRPDLPVLYTTGYTRNAIVHNGILDAGVELIGKPFTIDELALKVREVLDTALLKEKTL